MKKILLPLFLTICMVALFAPAVSADDTYVAKVGQNQYTSLQAAFDASDGSAAVIVLADCEQDVHIESGYHSLYLGGHTITGTVKMSSGYLNLNGPGIIRNTGLDEKYPIACLGGNYYLGSVTVEATAENGVAVYSGGNKLMTNGTPVVNGNVLVDRSGVFNINGGTFNGSLSCNQGGSLTVNGGSFRNDPSSIVPVGYKVQQDSGYYTVSVDTSVSIDALSTDSDGAYLIKTPGDVVIFRTLLSNAEGKNILSGLVFKLANDIDMTGVTLGAAGNDNKRFMGTFDGQNYTISNINIQAGTTTYTAFFGNTSGATIKDLTLCNVTVKGGRYTAGLVGYTRNTVIDNCKITGAIDISGGQDVAAIHGGGVVTITNCEVNGTGTVSGTIDVGAITGLLSQGSTTIKYNSITGITVKGNGLVGGLIGRAIASDNTLYVSDNTMTNVSVVSTASSYDQNGLAVGSLQVNDNSIVCYSNTFVNSTLTVAGVVSDTVYCNTNFDGTKAEDSGAAVLDPVAKIGTDVYFTLQAALEEAAKGESVTVQLLPGTFELGAVEFPAALKGVTIKGADNKATILKNSSFLSSTEPSISYENITIDGIVFDNSYIFFNGWRTSNDVVKYSDWTITNCEFHDVENEAAVFFSLGSTLSGDGDEAMENFTFTNNIIDGVMANEKSGVGITSVEGKVDFSGNVIKNVSWNAIQLLFVPTGSEVTIENNILESNADEGIVNIYGVVGDLTVDGNTMSQSFANQPFFCWVEDVQKNDGFISGGIFKGTGEAAMAELESCLVDGSQLFTMANGEYGVAETGAKVTVTYDGYHSVTVVAGTVISKFTPDNDGYELVGWYTEPEFVNEFDFSRPIIEDVTLYPCWKTDYHDIDTGYVMVLMKMLKMLDISVEIIEAEGGKIVVVVPEKIKYNKPAVCTVIPDEGYAVADVIVDGESVGAVKEYTIEKLKGKHTVTAVFEKITDNTEGEQ